MAKYALCIGINNYPGTENDLQGCVNDAQDWADALGKRGFEISTLFDAQARKSAVIAALQGLIARGKADDYMYVTFSGHGTWMPDDDSDEADGRDEALCPHDLAQGPLLDDELHEIFLQRNYRTRLVFISDSCHSGTVAKLARLNGGGSVGRIRYMPPAHFVQDATTLARARALERAPAKGKARSGALLLAGAQDTEFSWDASFGGKPNGAFTRVALDVLPTLSASATYKDWHRAIRTKLPSREYPQTPNITGTRTQLGWKIFG